MRPLDICAPPARAPLRRLFCWMTAALIAIAAAAPAFADEAIEDFRADIAVQRDGTVHAVETIRVRAEGNQIRRGIYRDISTTFEDAEGKVHRVDLDIVGLTRDGDPEPYHVERHGDFWRIFAGDENVFLPTGSHIYVLTYDTDRQIRWFDEKPELFWNVTGNDWTFPVLKATATLGLPDGVAPVAWDAYTGRIGERGANWRGSVGANNVLTIATTRRLEPGEGLTFVAEIPADAVALPTSGQRLSYFFRDNREWFIGGIGLVAVFFYYLWAWHRVGRDPERGTIIPLFHPPSGISPALASYIENWGLGSKAWQAFTASALALAVRGLLVFDQAGKDLVLERTATSADGVRDALPPGEKTVLDWVEEKGGKAEINQANGKSVQAIGQKFQASVKSEGGNRYFRRNLLYFGVGSALSALVLGAVALFGGLSDDEIGLLLGMLFFGMILSIFVVPIIASLFQKQSVGSLAISLIVAAGVIGFILYSLAGVLRETFGDTGSLAATLVAAMRGNAFLFAIVFLVPALNGIFYLLLQAPTKEGRPVMDELEGFKMYMETAESGRLNIDKTPEITTERFEALLPYAVALGVERPWANAFATALARAHPGDQDPMSHYHPRWRRGGNWSNANFGRSISSAVSSATSAMSSSVPRSSSSSSGFSGGSGGGGGGRGGGGW